MSVSNGTYDFFTWDSGNVSSVFWDTATSESACGFYFWEGFLLFIIIFVIPFLGSFALAATVYTMALILYVYKRRHYKNSQYAALDVTPQKHLMCNVWIRVSSIWHGHDIVGWENVPNSATIFIMYHAAVAIDVAYFIAKLTMFAGERLSYLIVHKKEVEVPGWRNVHEVMNCLAYTREECIEFLNDDSYLVITPGGMPESRFSNNKYRVFFDGRIGFADVILGAKEKVTVIPVFTRNIQEAFWVPWFLYSIVSGRCAPKHIPINPMVGGLPVKLTTFVGPPVEYEKTFTHEQLSNKVIESLQKLIDQHQRVPGNRLYALMERFCGFCAKKPSRIRKGHIIA